MSLAPYVLETRSNPITNYTQAFSLPPSQVWDGNDGAWSTFVIRVGNPPQYFRITPSTVGAESWVPIPDSCDRGVSWCGNARGVMPFNAGTSGPASGSPDDWNFGSATAPSNGGAANPLLAQGFVSNVSTTWAGKGNHQINVEAYLNSTATGQYGIDSVGIGADAAAGLTLDGIVVAGVPTLPFYLGKLGMRPSNTSGPDGNTPSFMTQLRSENKIPSLSYGYSAGALYKQQPVLGSLTFGGYDASRFIPNNMTFGIDKSANLNIPIQMISANQTLSKNTTLMANNITAVIDTTTPHTWLPLSVCQAFEKAFGLKWDDNTKLYLVNDTVHQQLLNQNPQITFQFGFFPSQTVNISLPYAAFDLQASKPFYDNGTNYFPIRRATTPNQYTLGRAFFQEAYLIADYDAGNFSVLQATSPPPPNSNIITINHNPSAPSIQGTSATPDKSTISHGAIAGIAIGASVALISIFVLLFLWYRRYRNKCRQEHARNNARSPKQLSMTFSSSTGRSGHMIDEKYDIKGSHGSSESSNSRSNTSNRNRDRDRGHHWDNDRDPRLQRSHSGLSPGGAAETTLIGSPTTYANGHSPVDGRIELDSPLKEGLSREYSLSKPLPRPPQELGGSEAARELYQRGSTSTAPGKGEKGWRDGYRSGSGARGSQDLDGPGSHVGHLGHMSSRRGSRRSQDTQGSGGLSTEEAQKKRIRHIYEMMA
ncbi:uncharacterized protein KY384_002248 [Bacidia gigantensis]|uniref:uncharacterized protein n=1 Tax=Bacidia gigantensis TaxID=2732470 RepID=UPI001D03F0DC|nr:uncharacterized protein KY384_002248 [Bacidia gigantensis]KAG8533465.1 hypothetical protein KY384_002248 [Bacidia gigantensis]